MATVVFNPMPLALAVGVFQRGTTGGGLGRVISGMPYPARFTYRYTARRTSDGSPISWSSDGPDPTGVRAGVAVVSGSISRLT